MAQRPLNRFLNLFMLVAVGAVIVAVVGQIWFPGNLKKILLGWVFLSLVVLIVAFLSWYLEPKSEATPRKDVISIFVSIASSLILIGTLAVGWLSLDSTQQQTRKNLLLSTATLENARAEQRSRRFMEALEKLGGETPNKRLAGVYAFRKLDEEFRSDDGWKQFLTTVDKSELDQLKETREAELKEHWAIVEILTHTIQELSPVPEDRKKLTAPQVRVEVYEIMKYLGGRKLFFGAGDLGNLNLINVDLRKYDFKDIRTTEKYCKEASLCDGHCRPNFDGAQLTRASLAGANLECFSLRHAKLADADLKGAILTRSDLTGADLTYAELQGADLTGVILSSDDQLEFTTADKDTKCPNGFVFDDTSHTCVKRP